MFYTEEDVTPAVTAAIELFGPVGAISNDKNVVKNVSIATREFGKLWYGDVDKATVKEKCLSLGARINQKIYMFEAHDNFEFNNNTLIYSAP